MLPNSFPTTRRPRLRVLANGVAVPGAVAVEVVSNNHYAADRFRLSIALGAGLGQAASYWSSTSDITIDVQIGFASDLLPDPLSLSPGWTSLIQGVVDTLEIDPIQGLVRLDGRDFTAALIEARTQETFANRTSSEIATLLAGRHGLNAVVTATKTPVGRYYQLEHDRITLDQFSRATTEWDLLVYLAQREGFDVFVEGRDLHFQPPGEASDVAVALRPTPALAGPANVAALRLSRALTLARDIEVTVKSWNSRQNRAFVQVARANRRQGGEKAKGPPQRYVFVRPNLSMDEALKLAQAKLAELSRHERVLDAQMPGDLALTPRSMVQLEGTGTEFDQLYFVDQIERRLDSQSGFTQHLRARNMSPANQTTVPADVVASTTEP